MRKIFLTFMVLIIIIMIFLSGCLGIEDDGDKDDDKGYYAETYNKIHISFMIEVNNSNEYSYIIIPAPVQNGKTLKFSEFQSNNDFNNYSYEFIDTEHGEGINISPIPTNNPSIWFDCEPYTVQGPFDIIQTDQLYKPDYPGLSMWETDDKSGYYWFFCSDNITEISYRYEYSDCYTFSDKGGIDNIEKPGWIKTKFMRVQEDMPM